MYSKTSKAKQMDEDALWEGQLGLRQGNKCSHRNAAIEKNVSVWGMQ
jgi:hypothetical protein